MIREYKDGKAEHINFFVGTEVEKSPAHGLLTLFVTGIQETNEILQRARATGVTHIYFGANQSFDPENKYRWDLWDLMIKETLLAGYWATLDLDVKYAETLLEYSMSEHRRFIPMISVKLPYAKLFNYNATVKIDDTGFEKSNPGVWCHKLHSLMDSENFTDWDEYKEDKVLK